MRVSNNGWHHLYYLDNILPPQRVGHSDLALAVMMFNLWAVLAHDDFLKGVVRVWESSGTIHISLAILHKVCMIIVGLASTSTCDMILPDTTSGPLRFDLWS